MPSEFVLNCQVDTKGNRSKKPCVLLGITGCIAAYKACDIVRELQRCDLEVRVLMTRSACQFIGPATLRALTRFDVTLDLFENASDPIVHISLAQKADLLIIAPCTANTLAKMACGLADNVLTSTALACSCPILVAPAMNSQMYKHPATQQNISTLAAQGVEVVGPKQSGVLACGIEGAGKLEDPRTIVQAALALLDTQGKPYGASVQEDKGYTQESPCVLISAGPTREPLDAVRYISNYSSGKMGFALSNAACSEGCKTQLVLGPVSDIPQMEAQVSHVVTAREMHNAMLEQARGADIIICAAAVSDMRPVHQHDFKLKKGKDSSLRSISFVENPDILSDIGKAYGRDASDKVVIGFAAESEAELHYATEKLIKKNCDMLIGQNIKRNEIFGADTTVAVIIKADSSECIEFKGSKTDLAKRIIVEAKKMLIEKKQRTLSSPNL